MTCQHCGQHEAEVGLPDGRGDQVLLCAHCSEDVLDGRAAR